LNLGEQIGWLARLEHKSGTDVFTELGNSPGGPAREIPLSKDRVAQAEFKFLDTAPKESLERDGARVHIGLLQARKHLAENQLGFAAGKLLKILLKVPIFVTGRETASAQALKLLGSVGPLERIQPGELSVEASGPEPLSLLFRGSGLGKKRHLARQAAGWVPESQEQARRK
jgi:hypothetical protein